LDVSFRPKNETLSSPLAEIFSFSSLHDWELNGEAMNGEEKSLFGGHF
jgi:hypothetical protein